AGCTSVDFLTSVTTSGGTASDSITIVPKIDTATAKKMAIYFEGYDAGVTKGYIDSIQIGNAAPTLYGPTSNAVTLLPAATGTFSKKNGFYVLLPVQPNTKIKINYIVGGSLIGHAAFAFEN
ncbi:MAG TPA: hypothetical protein VGM23_15515, partial [Armatimonadota bacterium]